MDRREAELTQQIEQVKAEILEMEAELNELHERTPEHLRGKNPPFSSLAIREFCQKTSRINLALHFAITLEEILDQVVRLRDAHYPMLEDARYYADQAPDRSR